MPSASLQEALAHLHAIPRPRAAGSVEESDARAYCRVQLESSGFSVTEEPFEFSSAVGRWSGPITGGVGFAALAGAAASLSGGSSGRFVGALVLSVLAVWFAGMAWALKHGVLMLPLARQRSVNLVACRGEPRVWLVAHLDTKSQPIPSLVRAAAFVLMIGAMLMVGFAGIAGLAEAHREGVAAIALTGAIGAIVLSLAGVGNESPGGADNASGLVTVLLTAQRLSRSRPLGILLTSAEELALAGARVWVRSQPPGLAVNIDTIDDAGAVRCMPHGPRARPLAAELHASAGDQGPPFVVRPLIPGILTDGVAFAGAGWVAVTLSRGTLATLSRIHRPGDTVGRLTGEGMNHLASVLATWLERDR